VAGDRSQLQNAILNLGINARDAMPSGGTLSITTRNLHLTPENSQHMAPTVVPGLYLEITMTDTGVGIDRETLRHIFEPFFTTKGHVGGTGLGLSIVYSTIKEHGGYIDVTSQPGQGTAFTLGLPVLETATAEADLAQDPVETRGSGCILIVDDESLVMRTMNDILNNLGYTTLTANNGKKALEIYTQYQENIDLIILDMIMPQMNGEQTLRELKRINPDVKVIISSGYMQDYRPEELVDLGAVGVLQKPFRKNELALKITQALRFTPEP
jgi:CheY-like chemotaxis protein